MPMEDTKEREQDPMEIVDENDLSDGKIPFNKTVTVLDHFPVTKVQNAILKMIENMPAGASYQQPEFKSQVQLPITGPSLTVSHCVVCQNETIYQCSKTDESVCSLECQRTRFSDPLSVDIQTNDAKSNEEVPLGKKYLLVRYLNAETLIVRAEDDHAEFIQLMNRIAYTVSKIAQKTYKANVSKQSHVFGFVEGYWYRGQIKDPVRGNCFKVLFPDLRACKIMHRKDLRLNADVELIKAESTAHKFTLVGVLRKRISYEAERILEDLVEKQTPLVAYATERTEMVFRVDHAGGPNLAEQLNKTLTMTVTNDQESVYLKDLPVQTITECMNVPMILTDVSDATLAISLAQFNYFTRCHEYETHFQEFADRSTGHYTPCTEELCLVRVSDQGEDGKHRWLRAYGLHNEGDRFPRFELLDYGVVVKVNIQHVRKMPKQLMYPAATRTYTTDKLDATAMAEIEGLGDYRIFHVMVSKIEPASAKQPTDRVIIENLVGQLKARL